jgi:murein DD-endopeptidase MepM/ murein hydrolase activator NlpD
MRDSQSPPPLPTVPDAPPGFHLLAGRFEAARPTLRSGSSRLWLPLRAGRCSGGKRAAPRPPGAWLRPIRFDYQVSGHELAIISLLADLDAAAGPPSSPSLVVRRAEERSSYPASAGETWPGRTLLWQVSFEVPLDVVEYPAALFSVGAGHRIAIALPAPGHRVELSDLLVPGPRRPFRPLIRRGAVALAAGLAFAAVSNSLIDVASAASTPALAARAGPAGPAAPETTGSGSGAAAGAPQPSPVSSACISSPGVSTTSATTAASQAPAGAAGRSRTGAVTTTCSTRTSTPSSAAGKDPKTSTAISKKRTPTPRRTTKTSIEELNLAGASVPGSFGHLSGIKRDSKPSAGCAPASATGNAKTPKTGRKAPRPETATTCGAPHSKVKSRKHRRDNLGTSAVPPSVGTSAVPPIGAAGLAVARRALSLRQKAGNNGRLERSLPSHSAGPAIPPSSSPWTAGFGIDPSIAAEIERFSTGSGSVYQPPAFLIPIFKAAGRKYDIPWQILAAINAIETGYGQDLAVSPKGAIGWMQFMPATWIEYGVAASGYGRPNPYDPRDAIFSAARLLAANGGARDLPRALFAYNHALWYVDAVLWGAALISDRGLHAHLVRNGYALPLDARYMAQLGRTDDGVDIEDAPDGAAVYSITPGVVTAVASNPSGFGPNYPVILVTAGPLMGRYIYYGHVAASLVTVGQHVVAGQPIAVMGHTGDAASLGHGHIEIGFSDGSGDPLDHHGAIAWTQSGAAMRTVLVALSSVFGIKNP